MLEHNPGGKVCPCCHIEKQHRYFANSKNKKDGKDSFCKSCRLRKAKTRHDLQFSKDSKDLKIRSMFSAAKKRAKKYNLDFDLDIQWLIQKANQTKICSILEIELDWTVSICQEFNSPSLDKIDPTRGYIKNNVQIISSKANRMKQDASKEELKLFAKWILQL